MRGMDIFDLNSIRQEAIARVQQRMERREVLEQWDVPQIDVSPAAVAFSAYESLIVSFFPDHRARACGHPYKRQDRDPQRRGAPRQETGEYDGELRDDRR